MIFTGNGLVKTRILSQITDIHYLLAINSKKSFIWTMVLHAVSTVNLFEDSFSKRNSAIKIVNFQYNVFEHFLSVSKVDNI